METLIRGCVLFGALLAATHAAYHRDQAAGAPWFGIPLPEIHAERAAAVRRLAYSAPDFGRAGGRAIGNRADVFGLDGRWLYRQAEQIVSITHRNRAPRARFWGRIAGSPAELETAAYLAQEFARTGLSRVRTEPVAGEAQWWPVDWRVTLVGAPSYGRNSQDYELSSAFPAMEPNPVALSMTLRDAELTYVGLGEPVDLARRELRGKVAVMHSVLEPNPFFQSARANVANLAQSGVAGIVIALAAPENHRYMLRDMGLRDVPTFVVGGDDGRFLKNVLAATVDSAPARINLSLHTEIRIGWVSQNVIGVIEGATDEYVVIVSHLDGYFDGANDNAGGLAILLGLARHFSDPRAPELRRHHLFIGTSGAHEHGAGVRSFLAAHPDILDNTVFVLNVEHPSSISSYYRGGMRFGPVDIPGQLVATTAEATRVASVSNRNPALMNFFRSAIENHGLVVDSSWGETVSGAASAFHAAGLPVVQTNDANLWYHSTGDRLDTIAPSGLATIGRGYAEFLRSVDALDRAELQSPGP